MAQEEERWKTEEGTCLHSVLPMVVSVAISRVGVSGCRVCLLSWHFSGIHSRNKDQFVGSESILLTSVVVAKYIKRGRLTVIVLMIYNQVIRRCFKPRSTLASDILL